MQGLTDLLPPGIHVKRNGPKGWRVIFPETERDYQTRDEAIQAVREHQAKLRATNKFLYGG